MDINIPTKIPKGPAAKILAFIVAVIIIYKYCNEWVENGLPNPLIPSTFIAIILVTLVFIITVYCWQGHLKKN